MAIALKKMPCHKLLKKKTLLKTKIIALYRAIIFYNVVQTHIVW